MTSQARRQLGRGSIEAGPCGVPPFCTLHRFAPGPATPRTDDANQADHTDDARRHTPSIANLRSKRRPLRPKHPFFGACGRGGLHVEHNTDNPPHHPVPIGGFCYHRTPMTACRRRVAPLWSQFPPDNKTKRGNRARTSWQPPLAPTTPTTPTRPDGTPQHREPTLTTSSASPQTPLFRRIRPRWTAR